ncbi:SGNH/GDSL hydrolase family protein [Streptomyces capparidis]
MRLSAPRGVLTSLAALLTAATVATGCTQEGDRSSDAPVTTAAPGPKSPSAAGARAWQDRPRSLAAVGDSITRGFDACRLLSDCPEVSWVTGSDARVDSLASRLLPKAAAGSSGPAAGGSWNLARSGARMADLPGQVRAAAAKDPDLVVILIGANDACRATPEAMTPVDDFRADFEESLATVRRELPEARIVVGSVPDLEQLWRVGRESPTARQVWRLGICPSMLADAESTDPADERRRAAVTERVERYNEVLQTSCEEVPGCVHDGGAVHEYRFTEEQLSPWDWFHPSVEGQAELARVLYEAVFEDAAFTRERDGRD